MATIVRPAGEPAALLREVARLHVRAQRTTMACNGVSLTQCTILTELGRAGSMTLLELARQLRLDKGWVSRAVDQLVQEGLVEKKPGASDRRTVALSLTRAGAAHHRRVEILLNDHVTRVMARVPRSQRAAVSRALELLHAGYVAELSAATGRDEEAA